jgi:hypothetical protein
MKRIYFISGLILSVIALSGCGALMTRTETDVYTLVSRDTTTSQQVRNEPGDRDNGIIYPSSRTTYSERTILRNDSIVEREYPAFIRLGLFESVGLLLAGSKDYAAGVGMFGIFPDFDSLKSKFRGSKDYSITGGIYRFGIGEWRLRWFKDAPDWTIGTSMFEVFVPDARIERMLASVFPLYIRKRFYLSEDIPYLSCTGSFGLGYYPSQYMNLSASFDVGSIGGLNFRTYLGVVVGANSSNTVQVRSSPDDVKEAQSVTMPYFGFGLSYLDFLNRVPETYQEWKDHEHSAWNVGLFQITAISAGVDKSIFDTESSDNASKTITGMILRIAPASMAIPLEFFDNKLYVGTSLFNLVALGMNQWGAGMLPLRVGFWQTILADELSTEPFLELNYYPSSFIHIGNRVNLRLNSSMNLNFTLGFASGNGDSHKFGIDITDQFGAQQSFSKVYFGIGLGIGDRIFFPEEVRYNK